MIVDECLPSEPYSSRPLLGRRSRMLCLGSFLLAAACASSNQISPQEPSASAQLLLVRSLDRAIAQLDVSRFVGRRVDVELVAQGGLKDFASELVKKRLRERGVQVSADAPAQKLQVFATVLGTDRGETLIGIPATYLPVLGIGSPQVAVFKWVRNRGLVELELDALEPQSGEVVNRFGPVVGTAKHDDYTLLIFITFTVTDTSAVLNSEVWKVVPRSLVNEPSSAPTANNSRAIRRDSAGSWRIRSHERSPIQSDHPLGPSTAMNRSTSAGVVTSAATG